VSNQPEDINRITQKAITDTTIGRDLKIGNVYQTTVITVHVDLRVQTAKLTPRHFLYFRFKVLTCIILTAVIFTFGAVVGLFFFQREGRTIINQSQPDLNIESFRVQNGR
jgi:hypothetical protein